MQIERETAAKSEAALKTLTKGDPKATEDKLIEISKENAILDMNLLKLTKKYGNLLEQEKMLRREYHNKDADLAEKDIYV